MIRKLIVHLCFTMSNKHSNTYKYVFMDPKRTHLPSINTLACSKAEVLSLCLKM